MRSLSISGPVALVFALAVFGLAPSVYWLDAGNLAASAWGMGVAHPPGEPAWLPLARLAQLVPVGDIAFRVNLLSACSIAGCAAPLLWACSDEEGGPRPAVVLLVLAVLLGFGARLQAVRAEVYGPTALILTTALAAALRLQGLRASAALGVLLGLGAGVHPLLCVAAAPALLLARGLRGPVGLRDLGWFLGAGAWSFAAYAWLPLRALADPSRAWGLPSSPGRFLDVLLARNFSRNFGADGGEGPLGNLLVVVELWQRAGVPLLVLLGLLACVRWRGSEPSRGSRALAAVLALWIVGNLATVLPQNKVFATNPDLFGYLLVGVLGAVPLAARGLARRARAASMTRTQMREQTPVILVCAPVRGVYGYNVVL